MKTLKEEGKKTQKVLIARCKAKSKSSKGIYIRQLLSI